MAKAIACFRRAFRSKRRARRWQRDARTAINAGATGPRHRGASRALRLWRFGLLLCRLRSAGTTSVPFRADQETLRHAGGYGGSTIRTSFIWLWITLKILKVIGALVGLVGVTWMHWPSKKLRVSNLLYRL